MAGKTKGYSARVICTERLEILEGHSKTRVILQLNLGLELAGMFCFQAH